MAVPEKITGAELAALLGIDERTIRKLTDRGVMRQIERGTYDLGEAVRAYVTHREQVTAAEAGQGQYGQARAELYRERAAAARMRREELERTLIPSHAVIAFNVGIVSIVRTRLLAIPSKIAPRLVGLKSAGAAMEIVQEAITEALTELSRMTVVPDQPARPRKVANGGTSAEL